MEFAVLLLSEHIAAVGQAATIIAPTGHDLPRCGGRVWLSHYDAAEHQGSVGTALLPLAQSSNEVALGMVVGRLAAAVSISGPGFPRSRAFSGTRLATLLMTTGDPREAAGIGGRVLDDAVNVRSGRLLAELRQLGKASARHRGIDEVAQLQDRITVLLRC